MLQIAYLVTHPETGDNVLAMPGETPQQAVVRYTKAVLGEDIVPPSLADFDYQPRWNNVYTEAQLGNMLGSVGFVCDPDTLAPLSVDDYRANEAHYQEERQLPLPPEVWNRV